MIYSPLVIALAGVPLLVNAVAPAPAGESTRNLARPHVGSAPYGQVIKQCVTPGTVALTFDDGPSAYTTQLLDILDQNKVKATFFLNGNSDTKGDMDDASTPWPAILKRMHSSGHQLASHSWTHEDLAKVGSATQEAEIISNEMAFRNIFGFIPTYFRCPYLSCSAADGSLALLDRLGYHVIDVNLDTKDYMYNDPVAIKNAKDKFANELSTDASRNSYITLAHDIHEQTVVSLTAYMIQTLKARGYKAVTVGECLGDPKENWYRTTGAARGGNGKVARAVSWSA